MIVVYALSLMVAILCCVIVTWAILAFKNHRRYRHLPGPPLDSFFLGNLPTILKYRREGKFESLFLYECHREYGFTFKMFSVFEPFVITCDPKTARELKLNSRSTKGRAFMEKHFANFCGSRFIGHGLFSLVNFKEHRERRLFLNPAFHKTALQSLMKQFNGSTTALIENLRILCGGNSTVEVDLAKLLAKTTLDVIAKVAFGLDLNEVKGTDSIFNKNVSELMLALGSTLADPLLQYKPWRRKEISNGHQNVKYLRNFGKEVILRRKAEVADGGGGKVYDDDMLSMMLKYEQENPTYTIEEQIDDFLTFIVAGQETTATNLSFTLMHLHRNPEWKELASREAEQVLGSKDNVDYDDLNKLPIISNCLKEALRLTPPASALGCEPLEDFVIPGDHEGRTEEANHAASLDYCRLRQGGKVIPAGTPTFISVYSMHRHPLIWSNADRFRPNRWAAKTQETSAPFAFIPFSFGGRSCIGQVFAQMEAKIILSRFLRCFDYEVVVGERSDELAEDLTLHLRHGLPAKLQIKPV